MTCERVLELSIGFLDGTLDGEARAAVADHLAGCDDCRGLIAALRDAPPEDPELTAAILRRTAGPICDSVRDRLCAWADASLDPTEAERVSGHLGGCPECAALGRALASMREELPRLAEVDPDPAFVTAVLARTSLRPPPAPLLERWLPAARRLLDRPRIALEGAFVAAMIVVLPLGALHDRGGAGPASTVDAIRRASGATSAGLNELAHAAWATTRGFVAERVAGVASRIGHAGTWPPESAPATPGTFSPAGASSPTSDETGGLDRKPRPAQERRR